MPKLEFSGRQICLCFWETCNDYKVEFTMFTMDSLCLVTHDKKIKKVAWKT